MKRFSVFIYFVICSRIVFCQGDIDAEKKLFYRNERSYSFSLTSTGWGINYRLAKHLNASDKKLTDIDFAILKHPQEYRQSNPYSGGWGTYVYGKKNIVFDFRYGIGRQKEIFRKFDIGGVSIRKFYSYGASLAVLKPVYFEVYDSLNVLSYQKFNYAIFEQPYYKIFRASFFRGFNELSLVPGIYIRAGMCFEFGSEDTKINAIEAGATLEGFLTQLQMVENAYNKQFIVSLFVSYRFGKVFDSKSTKKKRKENFFY